MSTLNAVQVTVELAEINCGECGGTYAINERYRKQCYDNHRSWTCPYCRTGWGYQNVKNDLDKEKERHQQTLARLNEERIRAVQIEAERLKLQRKLKRVAKGVCPDCQRTFTNLARHMACKHPKK